MPSYLKLKWPDDVLLAFGILMLVVIIISTAWGFRRGMPPTLAQVEKELAKIVPPAGAVATQHVSSSKWIQGTVGNYYQANLTYEQIRAHYDVESARHGWTFLKHEPLTSWGKNLGESQTTYCKGHHALHVYFTGTAPVGFRYTVNVSWGLGDC